MRGNRGKDGDGSGEDAHRNLMEKEGLGFGVGARLENDYRPALGDKHETSEGPGKWLR